MPFCTMSYDEAEGDLPDVCLRCGTRSACRVSKKIRLYDTATYGSGLIGGVLMLIDFGRYLGGPTLLLRGPFCAAHRGHWPFRVALVWGLVGLLPVLLLGVLALYLLGAIDGGTASALCPLAMFVCGLSATFAYGTATVKFGADEDNESLTLSHVHPKFIEALERRRDEREQRQVGGRAARAKVDEPAAYVRERSAPRAGGDPFADLGDSKRARPRRSASRRESRDQTALVVSLAVGVSVAILVLLAAAVGIGRMVETAAQRQQPAAIGEAPPQEPREEKRDVEPGGRVPGAPRKVPPPAELVGKASVDLVRLIVPRKDVVECRWLVADGALHCDRGSFVPRVQFPYRPPEEYDLVATFWQAELRNGISLVMPNPRGGSFFWFLGNEDGKGYGFHAEPDKGGRIPGLIKARTVHTTTVRVRKWGVSASVDGKELTRLETDFHDLTCDDWRKIRDTRFPAIACDDPTVFFYLRVVEVTGRGKNGR